MILQTNRILGTRDKGAVAVAAGSGVNENIRIFGDVESEWVCLTETAPSIVRTRRHHCEGSRTPLRPCKEQRASFCRVSTQDLEAPGPRCTRVHTVTKERPHLDLTAINEHPNPVHQARGPVCIWGPAALPARRRGSPALLCLLGAGRGTRGDVGLRGWVGYPVRPNVSRRNGRQGVASGIRGPACGHLRMESDIRANNGPRYPIVRSFGIPSPPPTNPRRTRMPAVRLSSRRGSAVGRRRSSLAGLSLARAGTYGYVPPTSPHAPVTFAPNVTPVSYSAPSPTPSPYGSPSLTTDLPLPLFPPSATPAPPPTRRRVPPGKRRSQGYVPRPPNAFMLFRADFVRQKHVPGSIETNHGSLSKIIGNCWRALPLPEKHIWETKAKHAKAEHKLKYPDYKFRPVHNKKGAASSASTSDAPPPPSQPPSRSTSGSTIKGQLSPQEDERRCEEVAALLLQGKKGEELAWAVRDLDLRRQAELASQSSPSPGPIPFHHNSKFPHPLNLDPMYYPHASPPSSSLATSVSAGSPYSLPMPLPQEGRDETWRHRRSSSVPLPNDYSYTFPPFMYGEGNGLGITLPSLGFSTASNYSLPPPPPSSGEDSLAGLPPSISGPGRMSYSWMNNGSTFSYPRPSFSFGAGSGVRGSFSFGGAWGGSNNNPIGRRASSAQAFFSASSFPNYSTEHHQPQQQEELPDADTSLFEAGFLHSFGTSASSSSSPTSDAVSPFDAAQQMLHAPQPVHAVSPLGVEFAEQHDGEFAEQQHQSQQTYEQEQEQQAYEQEHMQTYPTDDPYSSDPAYGSHHSTPSASSYVEENTATPPYADDAASGEEQQQHQPAEQAQAQEQPREDYPPFEFPTDHHLNFPTELRPTSIDMSASSPPYDMQMSNYDSYANEFV